MRTLDIYIGKNILHTILLVLGVLLGLFTFVNLIDELGNLGIGSYSIVDVFQYILYTTPRSIYDVFPMTALVGSVMGLSVMAQDSELTVMRAAGISLTRIAWAMIKVGFLLAICSFMIGEFILPKSDPAAERNRDIAMEKQIQGQTSSGFWVKDQKIFINIGSVLPDLTMIDLRVFEFDNDRKLRSIVTADRALYNKDDNKRWHLENIKQVTVDQNFSKIDKVELSEARWTTLITPKILNVFLIQPDQLPVWDLWRYIEYLKDNNQETGSYELTFWQKIILPLTTTMMMFVAIPFVFTQVRGGGMGVSLFGGIMLGILFFILQRGFGFFVLAYGIHPIIGALFPTFVFFMLAVWLILRLK